MGNRGISCRQSIKTIRSWLTLRSIPGVGNRLFLRLVDCFGDPDSVLIASRDMLMRVEGVYPKLAAVIAGYKTPESVDRDLEHADKNGFQIITFADQEYPPLLKQIADPPPLIYVYGRLNPDSTNMAIVGSRNATGYGRDMASTLGQNLAKRGFTIVSGMARGIDSAAHKGALEVGGETIAVLGCGLGTIYPPENRDLFHKIAHSGAVISEFAIADEPDAHRFPIRNRIISGLSLGVVIVEAAQRSGSLITANHAAEQGREVFAVPGSVTSFKSMGTHGLIKQGAKLVENIDDIIEELNLPPSFGGQKDSQRCPQNHVELEPKEKFILNKLSPYPIHIDELVQQSSMAASEVSSILLQLELKGLIIQSPGKLFAKSDKIIKAMAADS